MGQLSEVNNIFNSRKNMSHLIEFSGESENSDTFN